jgi:hypothetical protein
MPCKIVRLLYYIAIKAFEAKPADLCDQTHLGAWKAKGCVCGKYTVAMDVHLLGIIRSWVHKEVSHFTILLGHEFIYKSNKHNIIGSWVHLQVKHFTYWVMSSNTSQTFHNIIRIWVQIQGKHVTILGHEFKYKSNIPQYH